MRNADVIKAWIDGNISDNLVGFQFVTDKWVGTPSLKTNGLVLKSYDLVIGYTRQGSDDTLAGWAPDISSTDKIVLDYTTLGLGFISQTTSSHVNLAKGYKKFSHGKPDTIALVATSSRELAGKKADKKHTEIGCCVRITDAVGMGGSDRTYTNRIGELCGMPSQYQMHNYRWASYYKWFCWEHSGLEGMGVYESKIAYDASASFEAPPLTGRTHGVAVPSTGHDYAT